MDTQTGMRETLLSTLRAEAGEDIDEHPGQAYFDDPAHDAQFATHALSRVRAAQRWLINDSGLTLPVVAAGDPVGRIRLDASGCSVIPPPRFVLMPPGAFGMSDSMSTFTRVSLGTVDAGPDILGVWLLDHVTLDGSSQAALRELARQTVQDWVNEGAQGVRFEEREVGSPPDGAEVACVVEFDAHGQGNLEVQRWRVEPDGQVWRFGISGTAGCLSIDRCEADLAALRASFRRIDGTRPR